MLVHDIMCVCACVCVRVCVCVCVYHYTHINSRLLFVVLLLVRVNKTLPIDLELGTLWHLTYDITELRLARALVGEKHNMAR